MKKWLFLFLIVSALFNISCNKPKSFDYRDVRNFSIDKFGFDNTTVKMDLVYFNPNNFGITFKNVSCDIFINNNYLGHFSLDTSLFIDKKSEFVLPSKFGVDMKNIYKNTLNALLSKEVDVNVKGTARIKKIINLTIPFDYRGKHRFF